MPSYVNAIGRWSGSARAGPYNIITVVRPCAHVSRSDWLCSRTTRDPCRIFCGASWMDCLRAKSVLYFTPSDALTRGHPSRPNINYVRFAVHYYRDVRSSVRSRAAAKRRRCGGSTAVGDRKRTRCVCVRCVRATTRASMSTRRTPNVKGTTMRAAQPSRLVVVTGAWSVLLVAAALLTAAQPPAINSADPATDSARQTPVGGWAKRSFTTPTPVDSEVSNGRTQRIDANENRFRT